MRYSRSGFSARRRKAAPGTESTFPMRPWRRPGSGVQKTPSPGGRGRNASAMRALCAS